MVPIYELTLSRLAFFGLKVLFVGERGERAPSKIFLLLNEMQRNLEGEVIKSWPINQYLN